MRSIILFDGVCNLCNSSVNFVLDRDKEKKFMFAALQSDIGKKLLLSHDINLPGNYDSVILIKDSKVYKKSAAALEIAKDLGGVWQLLYIFKIIPSFVSNILYDLVANNRYRFFGKREVCRMPEPGVQERFLE